MSIQAPQGILNIPNAILRVGKLSVDEVVGADTILNTVARNTILLVDDEAYHENKNWALKLPNAWAGEFECNTASAGNYSEFNFYNEGASSNVQGYNLTFNDTAVELRYDGTLLKTGTLASTITGTGVKKVRLMFERTILSVTVDGTLVFTHDDTVGPRPRVYSTTAGGFLNFFTDGGALKNLKIVNEKWMSDGTSNIAYVGGGEVAVGQALAFNRVSNVSQIKVDSNVVTEYTGPHDRPLRKYPEVALTADAETASGYKGYKVTVSSLGLGDGTGYYAFDGNYADGSTVWGSGDFYNSSGGDATVSGAASTTVSGVSGAVIGEWIGLQLPNKIRLQDVKIAPQSYAGTQYGPPRTPTKGVIAGSTDGTNWELVHAFTTGGSSQIPVYYLSSIGPIISTKYYNYFRIIAEEIVGGSNGTRFNLEELCFYGHEEGSGSLDTTLKSVYNVPATTGTQLEVYYDAKDLDNGAVTSVTDLSPNTNNGTLSGDPQISNGAFVFDGSGDAIVSSGTSTSLDGNATFSISLWSKTNTVSSGSNALFMLGYSSANKSTGLRIDASTGKYRFFTTGGLSSKTSPTTALLNEWTHITLIHEGTSGYKFYVNGVFIDEITVDNDLSLDSNPRVALGNYIDAAGVVTGTASYDGSIANFRLYSKALNADQIKELYDYQKDYFLGSKSQVTLYKGHLGVGVTEPSGQLELAGDERIQSIPPRGLERTPREVYDGMTADEFVEGHGVFNVSASGGQLPDYNGAQLVFRRQSPFTAVAGDLNYWSRAGVYNSSGIHTGTAKTAISGGGTLNGEWIQLSSPYGYYLKKTVLYHRYSSSTPTWERARMPKDFTFVGSNNGSSWSVIKSFGNISYEALKGKDLEIDSKIVYKDVRLIVHSIVAVNPDGVSGNETTLDIGQWHLFGTPGPTTLDKGSLSLGRSLDVPRVSRYDVDTETPRPEKLLVDLDTTVNSSPTDISGQGNHGAFYNGAYYSAADKAFVFDGTDDLIRATVQVTPDFAHSVSVWIKVDTVGENTFFSLGNETTVGTDLTLKSSTVYTTGSGFTFTFYGGDMTIPFSYSTDRWYHIVATRDTGGTFPNTQKFYIDGVDYSASASWNNSTSTTLALPTTATLLIGKILWATSARFDGQISNFKLYNVALEHSEVQKLYRLGRTGRSMVISDTAVGIGKVPEAQLDVRGSIKGINMTTCPVFFDATASATTVQNNNMNFDSVNASFGGGLVGTRFTAPIRGYYYFSIFFMGQYVSAGQLWASFMKNGSEEGLSAENARIYDNRATGDTQRHGQNSGSAIIFLNGTGDYVEILNKGGISIHGQYNRFQGFYLSG